MLRILFAALLAATSVKPPSEGPTAAEAPVVGSLSQADQGKLVQALLGEPQRPLKVRLQAAVILGRSGGAAAVPSLVVGLSDPDHPVRGACALALGNIGDLRAIESLVTAIDDHEEFVRAEARTALGKMARPEALPYLQSATLRGSLRVRLAMVDILSRIRGADAGTLLADLVADADERVRTQAERALGPMDAAAATALLLRGLDHPHYRVRMRCAELLGQRREKKAVEKLAALALSPLEAVEVQDASRQSLRQLKDQIDAVQLAVAARDTARERAERGRSMLLLAIVGAPDALQVGLDLLDDVEESMRGSAAQALAELGDPRALAKLREAQGRPDNTRIAGVVGLSIRKLERGTAR